MSAARGSRRVVVVGGGLAGITAAVALREAGEDVTLLEARPRLGGATASFRRNGLVVDTGQHVFLRCCTAYRGLLARLGVAGSVALQDRFEVTVLAPGRRAVLRRTALPGPLHMARALTGYGFLTPAQRLRVAPAALAMAARGADGAGAVGERLGDWLATRWQDERTRRLLWDLFTVSSLNIDGDEADLALASVVIKTALLGAKDAADIGTPAVPLGELHGEAAAALFARNGVGLLLSAKVTAIERAPGGGFAVRLRGRHPDGKPADERADGGVLRADAVVLAAPPHEAAELLPPGAITAGPGPQQWRRLGSSPIVNVHVVYDRRVTRLPFAAAVDSPVQWVFDRTGPSGLRQGQYLAVSLSAADGYVDVPAARMRDIFVPALAELFPAARDALVTDFFVTRERRATVRQAPGCGGLRPGPATALPGLALAGAWTSTGWPDTMEGAVRSGLNAARHLRRELAAMPAASARMQPQEPADSGEAGMAGAPRQGSEADSAGAVA